MLGFEPAVRCASCRRMIDISYTVAVGRVVDGDGCRVHTCRPCCREIAARAVHWPPHVGRPLPPAVRPAAFATAARRPAEII